MGHAPTMPFAPTVPGVLPQLCPTYVSAGYQIAQISPAVTRLKSLKYPVGFHCSISISLSLQSFNLVNIPPQDDRSTGARELWRSAISVTTIETVHCSHCP